MTKLGVSLPMLNQPVSAYASMARAAEEAGFDSLWNYEFYRNPFVIHGAGSAATDRIQLCTGVAAGVGRSPFEMANAAADVDELSAGRLVLGVGLGGPGWAELFHGGPIDHPARRLREYVEVLRLAWHHLASGEPVSFAGRFYRFENPPINPWGGRPLARPAIPVYTAGIRPKMVQLAGEVADGLLVYLATPTFVAEHVRPNLEEGARRTGRDPSAVELVSLVICSVSEDRQQALRLARFNVGMYVAYPVSAPMVETMGLEKDRDTVLAALFGEGPAALERVTSDELVEAFAIAGTPEECADQLRRYEGVLDHVVLHTPYVPPITAEESSDAFHAIVKHLGPVHRPVNG